MERFSQITLPKVDFDDLRKVLNIVIFRAPIHFDKYYARTNLMAEISYEIWYEAAEFGVHDLNHNMLGVIKIKDLSNTTIISFYITDSQYQQAFLEYFRWIIEEIKLAGITILDTQVFSDDTINFEDDKKPYVPKTKPALKRWRDSYAIIKTMRDEIENSDDWELFIPKLADFRDRIKEELKLEYDKKTISQITKAGDAGLLNE